MGHISRGGRMGFVALTFALVLASCGFGTTNPAQEVTDVSARLTGVARSTEPGTTTYWFEYGTTTSYGTATATGTVEITNPSDGVPVGATVLGLDEAATYHQRLCLRGADGLGTCGGDQPFTTSSGTDSVTGSGTVFSIPDVGFAIGGTLDVRALPDGSSPTGTAATVPGRFYFRLADSGPATCLRVEGNRATVGFLSDPSDYGLDEPPVQVLVYVEDNGPTGDRFGLTSQADPVTACPSPAGYGFPSFSVGGVPVPPVLTTGGFVVHDHPSGG